MSGACYLALNETQGLTLVGKMRRAESFVARLRGLMFRRRLGADEGLLLIGQRESRIDAAIHMFFVFFPIGVLWLDSENRVVDRVVARPFRPLYVTRAPAANVLECQPQVLEKAAIGDTIRFTSSEVNDAA
jgi:uncharacterized membrane protein (UPF0127 family)